MQTRILSTPAAFYSLFRADGIAQWRNRRSVIMVLIVPVIILISWKGLVEKFGGSFVLSNCITIGLTAIGLMGYSNSIARAREQGVFQRLRVAPISAWSIMMSRLAIQLIMIMSMTVVVLIAGYYFDHISLTAGGYALCILTAFVGGAVYLGLGQAIVGLIKNPETVNSTTRLVYFIFIMVGMFGGLGVLGKDLGEAVKWSPYGTVKEILSSSMTPVSWSRHSTMALLLTIGYSAVFSTMGIKWFKWNSR
jgi:ABC-2 type transport system permease protein